MRNEEYLRICSQKEQQLSDRLDVPGDSIVQLELSDRSVRRTLKLDFQFYPYPTTKSKLWFQQDTATDHITQNSLDVLRENVSMRGDAGWPAQSPDLSIFYFE